MAAQVMEACGDDEGLCPRIWSLTVFFEMYMTSGSVGTVQDFGPKEPVDIRITNENAQ